MKKDVIMVGQNCVDSSVLDELICRNIAGNNTNLIKSIKSNHMHKIFCIRDFMMSVLGGNYADARMLNSCFHLALRELNINLEDFFALPICTVDKSSMAVK